MSRSNMDIAYDHLLPCRPDTVVWGYLAPGLHSPLTISSGQTVRIGTINVGGMPLPGSELDDLLDRHGLPAW